VFQSIASFSHVVFAKTLQIPVFLAGLLWELEVIQVKKTPVLMTHFKLLVEENIAKNRKPV